ncbi:MAG: radical SAM protein [Clostridia bacterium]|nr:radical SAM protein [Clostridia bacterium]
MGLNKRLRKYAEENLQGMVHTTLNPEGPGVVRIHLVPPRFDGENVINSVAIINGQDIIPVDVSWTVLLTEFIKEVNKYDGKPVNDQDVENIVNATLKNVRKVYHLLPKKKVREGIYKLMNSFKQIAYGEEVTEEIGYLNIGEYADSMRAPHRMDLLVSAMTKDGHWHCNQKCVHCYAAGQVYAEEQELSTEEWKKVIDKCREVCIPQLTFTGGEPTMRDDLPELIRYAAWFVTRLNTNGIRLTKELCRELREASLDSMQITFYSDEEEIHNALVGANHYKDTVAGIENAVEAGISVSINTPLCVSNRDYVKTLRFLKEKGVQFVTCSGLITTGNAETEQSTSLQLSKEEIKAILKDAVEFCYANEMEISFTSPGWIEKEFFDELGISTPTCGACLSNMAITPSGNVVPCQSWLSGDALGNILTDDWKRIWDGPLCSERRAYSAEMLGECPLRKYTGGEN